MVSRTVTHNKKDIVFSTKSAASLSSLESITTPENTGMSAAL